MKYKVLIADDEPLAREKLRDFIGDEFDFELLAEASNGKEVLQQIREQEPDLLFLDIEMPGIDGMQVAKQLTGSHLPLVVFTTAHANYAVDAYAANVVDYLLKPFNRERFRHTLARVREILGWRTARTPPSDPRRQRLLVKSRGRYTVVQAEEITWLEAAANYVVLHATNGNHVVRGTMADTLQQLGEGLFFRIGRSHAVNLSRVSEVHMEDSGQHSVVLQGGTRLKLQRNFRELQQRLESLPHSSPPAS